MKSDVLKPNYLIYCICSCAQITANKAVHAKCGVIWKEGEMNSGFYNHYLFYLLEYDGDIIFDMHILETSCSIT